METECGISKNIAKKLEKNIDN